MQVAWSTSALKLITHRSGNAKVCVSCCADEKAYASLWALTNTDPITEDWTYDTGYICYGLGIDSSGNTISCGDKENEYAKKISDAGSLIWAYGSETLDMDGVFADGTNVFLAGQRDLNGHCIVKLNSSGVKQWGWVDGDNHAALTVAVGSNGDIAIGLDGANNENEITAYLLNSSRSTLWSKNTDGRDILAVAFTTGGDVLIGGRKYGGSNHNLRKIDRDTGNVIWGKEYFTIVTGIAIDGSGNIYISGAVTSGISSVRKLDSDGNSLWARLSSGNSLGIVVDSYSKAYVVTNQTGNINVYVIESNGTLGPYYSLVDSLTLSYSIGLSPDENIIYIGTQVKKRD